MATEFRDIAPVFPVGDLDAALDHYEDLGFEVRRHDDGYGYATRDTVTVHLAAISGLDPLRSNSAAYLFVDDADELASEWTEVEGGRLVEPEDTDYGVREGAHVDPDGNMIRFGAPIP